MAPLYIRKVLLIGGYDFYKYVYFEKIVVIEKIYFKTVYNCYFLWYNVVGENWQTRLYFRCAETKNKKRQNQT